MNKLLRVILIIAIVILVGFIFIRPPIAKMYCENESHKLDVSLTDEEATIVINNMNNAGIYSAYGLPANLEQTREKIVKESDKRVAYNQRLVNQDYTECLHRWGQ